MEWKDLESGEHPVACVDCAVVIYNDDYEFARYDGSDWQVWEEGEWTDAISDIRFWARLERPDD